ncbi:glycogen/starch synthase [Elizabethkingia anophelis]|uniref:glycogen/starch synthase n=1 Tax=Elizabethkingia anophelis TaxID=1117645 RepID=UPI0016272E3D|nr:glycogen/starch synthase [Elizabethkingia anophelis]MCT3646377.1 glycogen/starch synthase [Elizabethkingia anophelis]MCT3647463.1 glycogen/starch synthase [Elizabethkingia anophelis]MCT3693986.1 glycogen/starch synthase [Elizabethkingia anophelis]MCT3858485.1 glycogen/starch synthase [Elizabethkingia anophelis]MCT3911797.1 glycogen/starch synthase [Elizabethkingia anophelis]
MPNQKILYVTSELFPYQEDSNMATMVNKMALRMYNDGNDVRVFMPRFGMISERKFQLHEVIRLSGMNIIINDLDQPLLIKVASLPNERMQVYFIDNEEYFKRKQLYFDDEGVAFSDNDERAIFFARGVIETIKKLNWVPDVIHLNGWMASFIPLYLKTFYKNDDYFKDTKLVVSIYNEKDAAFENNIEEKLKFDNIEGLTALDKPSFRKFVGESLHLVDIVLKGDESLEDDLESMYTGTTSDKKDFVSADAINQVY